MNHSIVDSEHFKLPAGVNAGISVPNLDAAPMKKASGARRTAIWPVVAIAIGGLATVAWNGFLIWHTARAVFGWVGVEL
jgi:hypothetical protein